MSSLNITPDPWRAFPGQDTTIRQLQNAIQAFPEIVINVAPMSFEISFQLELGEDTPPSTHELAAILYPDDEELIVSEDTLGSIKALDVEAQDRHFEEDADRDMIGDDVDLGIGNIGNK